MFGYEHVKLTPDQVEARRKLLDQVGYQGYLLPIVLLSTVYVFRLLASFGRSDVPGVINHKSPNAVQLWFRRARWLLADTYTPEYGPLHVQVIGAAYTSILLYLAIRGTGNDYIHVTKSFAHVAISQLPIHFLLAFKHPQSPVTLATGLTHERLNAYHRLLGRVIHVFLAVHTVLFVRFFYVLDILAKRFRDWDVRYGFTAISILSVLGLLALQSVRKRFYHKLFYRSHVILSVLFAIVVWLHVPYTRVYAVQAGFFWVVNGALRTSTMSESARVRCQSFGGRLVGLTAVVKGGATWKAWVPGMHGYLNQAGLGPRTPFTVIDVTEKNGHTCVNLVVRDLGGPMTRILGEAARADKELTLELEGPYGEAKEYMPSVLKRSEDKILVIGGGVGATYALPIYLALAEQRKSAADVQFVLVVKTLDDAKWVLDFLRGKANRNVQIHITQGQKEKTAAAAAAALAMPGVEVHLEGRPNIGQVVSSFLQSPNTSWQPVSVMVCGPGRLSTDFRKALEKDAWRGRTVRWYEEQFGFGGS